MEQQGFPSCKTKKPKCQDFLHGIRLAPLGYLQVPYTSTPAWPSSCSSLLMIFPLQLQRKLLRKVFLCMEEPSELQTRTGSAPSLHTLVTTQRFLNQHPIPNRLQKEKTNIFCACVQGNWRVFQNSRFLWKISSLHCRTPTRKDHSNYDEAVARSTITFQLFKFWLLFILG